MAKSIFSTPLQELTIEDIRAFCEQKIPENERIDYTRDPGGQVVEKIAAMANTDGGVILIGVSEAPDARGVPGALDGYLAPHQTELYLTLANQCQAYLVPPWVPQEVWEYPLENGKKIAVIRVDPTEVPELPVYHREKGVLVRRGPRNAPADLQELRRLLVKTEEGDREVRRSLAHYFSTNLSNFTWFCLWVELPTKRLISRGRWNDEEINTLKDALYNHKIHNRHVWTRHFCPSPHPIEGTQKLALWEKQLQLVGGCEIHITRCGGQIIRFLPSPVSSKYSSGQRSPDPQLGYWYWLTFHSQGHILSSIGYSWRFQWPLEKIFEAFFAPLALLQVDEFQRCYPNCLWEGGKLRLRAQVSQWATIYMFHSDPDSAICWPEESPTQSSQFGPWEYEMQGPLDNGKTEEIASFFTAEFLAAVGCYGFDRELEKFRERAFR